MLPKSSIVIATGIAAFLVLAGGGCCQHCAQQRDFPIGAIPSPVGTYACQWQQAHAAAAHADGHVIFLADWIGDSTRLGPAAQKRLSSLADQDGAPIDRLLVQKSEDSDLDQRRRSAVTGLLASRGLDLPAESVVIGEPEALGLYDSSQVLGRTGAIGGFDPTFGPPGLGNPF